MNKTMLMLGCMMVAAIMLWSCSGELDQNDFNKRIKLVNCGGKAVELLISPRASDAEIQMTCIEAGY